MVVREDVGAQMRHTTTRSLDRDAPFFVVTRDRNLDETSLE
jgi:hypothetical protein